MLIDGQKERQLKWNKVCSDRYTLQKMLSDPAGWKAFWKTFVLQGDKHNVLEPFDLSDISLETLFLVSF